MEPRAPANVATAAAPQILTGSRLLLGAAALIAALDGALHLSATLIALGAVTDGLDGPVARRLGVTYTRGNVDVVRIGKGGLPTRLGEALGVRIGVLATCAVWIGLWPSAARAQDVARNFVELQGRVLIGETVTATDQAGQVTRGKLVNLTPAELTLNTETGLRTLAGCDLTKVQARRIGPLWNGAVIGAAVGVVPYIIAGANCMTATSRFLPCFPAPWALASASGSTRSSRAT